MYKKEESMKYEEVMNGVILPQVQVPHGPRWGLGGVCDAHNNFVELSEFHGGWAEHGGYYAWDSEVFIKESVVYFGVFFKHWGHFLVDLIGRMWFFTQENREKEQLKLVFLGEEEPDGNYLEFFNLLGIKKEQLIHVSKPTRFHKVIVPQYSSRPCIWYTKEFQSIFDTIADRVSKEGYICSQKNLNKIYFTRLNFSKAQGNEVGEKYIAKWLEYNGYTLMSPEKLSLRDQVYIWNHAKEIVCMDGTIPLNIGFSKNPQLRLIVMHKSSFVHKNLDLYVLMRGCAVTFLDVYYEPFKKYPKSLGEGPFLFCISKDIKEFSKDKKMRLPFSELNIKLDFIFNYFKLISRIINIKKRLKNVITKSLPDRIQMEMRKKLWKEK